MSTLPDKTILWIHGDNLNPKSTLFQEYPNSPAVFVWDEALLKEWEISLKRIIFMYECLLEMPVSIRRGDVAQEVVQFALEHGSGRIFTTASPSPRFRVLCQRIAQGMPSGSRLAVRHIESFVEYDGHIDLKRFSRYWNTVKKAAMR